MYTYMHLNSNPFNPERLIIGDVLRGYQVLTLKDKRIRRELGSKTDGDIQASNRTH